MKEMTLIIDKPKEFPDIEKMEYFYWLSVFGSEKALQEITKIKKKIKKVFEQKRDKYLYERNDS